MTLVASLSSCSRLQICGKTHYVWVWPLQLIKMCKERCSCMRIKLDVLQRIWERSLPSCPQPCFHTGTWANMVASRRWARGRLRKAHEENRYKWLSYISVIDVTRLFAAATSNWQTNESSLRSLGTAMHTRPTIIVRWHNFALLIYFCSLEHSCVFAYVFQVVFHKGLHLRVDHVPTFG